MSFGDINELTKYLIMFKKINLKPTSLKKLMP